jgi:hypothetical protein
MLSSANPVFSTLLVRRRLPVDSSSNLTFDKVDL